MYIKVSVIIPVYNAERHIRECIESLINQTLKECEFIFINDGSTDRSCHIIEEYRERDGRIKLINQENHGVSHARNKGLELSRGEYTGFVDADDYIEKNMYETLYSAAQKEKCDVVISNFISEIDGHEVITRNSFPVDTILNKEEKKELLLYFLKSDNLNTVWSKLYRNKVIRHNNVVFPENVVLGEDGIFNFRYLSKAETIKFINYNGYHYREVQGSATRNISKNNYFQRALDVYENEIENEFLKGVDAKKIQKYKVVKLINSVFSYIHIYFTPTKEMSFSKRYKYVRDMISDHRVQEAITLYYREVNSSLGRYEKVLIGAIKRRFILGVYCITAYSRFRNKKAGVIKSENHDVCS